MGSVSDIPDAELIRRAIDALRPLVPLAPLARGRTVPLWSKVSVRFCLGSTYAEQLCVRFGFDPDEQVKP